MGMPQVLPLKLQDQEAEALPPMLPEQRNWTHFHILAPEHYPMMLQSSLQQRWWTCH
jgi:hypothetical protein